MTKISIKLRNYQGKKDQKFPLYVVFYLKGKKIRLFTQLYSLFDQWDPVKECFKGRSKEVNDKNLILFNIKSRVTDILVAARLRGEALTEARFRQLYSSPDREVDFFSFAREHLKQNAGALQWETRRHHSAVLDKFEAFCPGVSFQEITPELLRSFARHLREVKHNNSGTINKNMGVIRVYYYAAMRAGHVTSNPFDLYKAPRPDPRVVFLTDEEFSKMAAMYKAGGLPDNEHAVLRFWLFMAFTGMHITDARNLQIEHIIGGEIHYIRQKTKMRVEVPLSAPARQLVDFYKGDRYHGPLFLNLPTDQAINRILHRIAKRAGINKPICAKAARHTFATVFYRRTNDLGTLSKLLGHASINTTMIYTHISNDKRKAGVSVFDGML